MFAVTPFRAQRHGMTNKDGRLVETWTECRVIGIDASRDEPRYIVEVSNAGETCLDFADLIKSHSFEHRS